MNEFEVVATPEFKNEILSIYNYVAEILLVPDIAVKLYKKIMESAKSLNQMPFRNPLYEHEPWKSKGLRKMQVDSFLIFYIANEQTYEVVLLHIFYGGQDIQSFLRH